MIAAERSVSVENLGIEDEKTLTHVGKAASG